MHFIISQKLFSFSRYLIFCLDFFFVCQNGFNKKIKLISNFMTSQPGQKTIVIHILPNISRSKGNQTMKFDPFIEYNMTNMFLEKSYAKYDEETSPRLFPEKRKLSIFLDQEPKVLYSLFYCMPSLGLLKHNETKLHTTFFYLLLSFLKNKKRSWT